MEKKQGSNLVVCTFEGEDAAEALYKEIDVLAAKGQVVIEDAVILERGPDALNSLKDDAVRVKQTHGKKGKYAAVGGGIGLLAAAILGGPIGLVAVASAGLGAVTAALKDFGVSDDVVKSVKQGLQPNTSALLLLGRANDRDALLELLGAYNAKVVMTSLDPDVERELLARLPS